MVRVAVIERSPRTYSDVKIIDNLLLEGVASAE